MSTLDIHLDLGNAAFDGDDLPGEVARILRELARKIENTARDDLEGHTFTPCDINGNKVGTVDFEIEEADYDEREDVKTFVKDMSTDDMRKVLQELCGCQCYDHETREIWFDALVENIVDGTTNVDEIKSYLEANP